MDGCRTALYASNSNSQDLSTGSIINFGTANRKFGCHAYMENGNLVLKGVGYYEVTVDIDITATAGNTVIAFTKDGNPIAGTNIALTTTATDYALTRTFIVKNTCPCDSVITVTNTGVPATLINATITAVKV